MVGAAAAIGLLIYFAKVLEPFIIALFVFFALRPIARWARRQGISPLMTYLTMLAVVGMASVWIAQVLLDTAHDFLRDGGSYRQKLVSLVDWFARFTGRATPDGHFDWENESVAELLNIDTHSIVEHLTEMVMLFVEAAVMFFFYLFFIILESEKLPRRIQAAFPARTAAEVMSVAGTAARGIQGYLFVKTWVSLGMGLTGGLIMWWFDLDYWPLWALLIVLFNYVTYLGSMVACLPPAVIACLQFWPHWGTALLLITLIIANRFFWIDYIEIQFAGRKLNISPVLLLLALAAGGSIWGLVGLVLAVPVLTAVKIALGSFESTRRYSILMSEDAIVRRRDVLPKMPIKGE